MLKKDYAFYCSTALILLFLVHSVAAGYSEAGPVITVFPYGARQVAMGGVGVALADDENVLYWNPAGLGFQNQRWQGGAVSRFHEQLLPVFRLPELWHGSVSAVYQPQSVNVGGLATSISFLNLGREKIWFFIDTVTGEWERVESDFLSYEVMATAGWGYSPGHIILKNHSFGINLKYIQSMLSPFAHGRTFAFDLGYLWQFNKQMRLGFTMVNMGLPLRYSVAVPLPFGLNLAVCRQKKIEINGLRALEINSEFRLSRIFAKSYYDRDPDPFYVAFYTDIADTTAMANLREVEYAFGTEVVVLNSGIFRVGFLGDPSGERHELHFGFGIRLHNHLQIDSYHIFAPRIKYYNSGARNWQWGIAMTMFGLGRKKERDKRWWESEN